MFFLYLKNFLKNMFRHILDWPPYFRAFSSLKYDYVNKWINDILVSSTQITKDRCELHSKYTNITY